MAQSSFYKRLEEEQQRERHARIFRDRPANLHDYQGCAHDAAEAATGKKLPKMLIFNLERALAGEPLITRSGHPATGFRRRNVNHPANYPFEAMVDGKSRCYTASGTYWLTTEDPLDLFLAGAQG